MMSHVSPGRRPGAARRSIGACLIVGAVVALAAPRSAAQSSASDEEVARRQLESGRSFMRQKDYAEALKDFRAVADTHASSSVADDALLEIARYYFDIADDPASAATAVDAILKKYPTSNSAPDAYLIAGRLALFHGHQSADLDGALANFERGFRLFPTSTAVPRALQLAGETQWFAGRFDESLADLGRVEAEYPTTTAAAEAYLSESRVLVARGDAVGAMEDLQQVRNRWPGSPEAATALAQLTLLDRLYIRAKAGTPWVLTTETAGPAKIENGVGVIVTSRGAIYWANDSTVGVIAPPDAPHAQAAAKPKGLTQDHVGNLVVIDGGVLWPLSGTPAPLVVPRSNGSLEALKDIVDAVELSNGDWIVMDDGEHNIDRFSSALKYLGPFGTTRVSKMALNASDEIACLDRDQKTITLLDTTGKNVGRIPFKGTGYDLQSPEDLGFDAYGHLYVLDHTSIAVFSPYPPGGDGGSRGAGPAGAGDRGSAYRLLTVFAPGEKSPDAIHKATSFAIDGSGGVYLYDDHAQRVLVYR